MKVFEHLLPMGSTQLCAEDITSRDMAMIVVVYTRDWRERKRERETERKREGGREGGREGER